MPSSGTQTRARANVDRVMRPLPVFESQNVTFPHRYMKTIASDHKTGVLNDAQLCEFLQTTPRTLRLWRNTRGLPHIKITSRVIRYRLADVEDWLQERSLGGAR